MSVAITERIYTPLQNHFLNRLTGLYRMRMQFDSNQLKPNALDGDEKLQGRLISRAIYTAKMDCAYAGLDKDFVYDELMKIEAVDTESVASFMKGYESALRLRDKMERQENQETESFKFD